MIKSQIAILKRLMKDERSCIIDNGGKEVLVSGALAVITLESYAKALDVKVDQKRKGLSVLIDCLAQPCYTSELKTEISVPDLIRFIKESPEIRPIYDFGPGLPYAQAKLLRDCIALIGEKVSVTVSFNPENPLKMAMLIYSPDRPQTMCILMPVWKGERNEK